MTALNHHIIKRIVRNLILPGADHRAEIISILDAQFLEFAISFFKKIAEAKLNDESVTLDWYRNNFLRDDLSKEKIALNAGLNIKTINNMHSSTRKEVVIGAANHHFENLKELVENLTRGDEDINFMLTIQLRKVSIELNMNESLIVINSLSVHRAAIRGGLWSSAGKRAEKLLMMTLCRLYSVDDKYWDVVQKSEDGHAAFAREVDFFLVNKRNRYKCEVKLMGKGNPESADAVIARGSQIFVADTLSDTNTAQLDSLRVH